MKKILVGLDESRQSHKALDYAINLGKKFKSRIFVLSVAGFPAMDVSNNLMRPYMEDNTELFKALHKNALNKLKKAGIKGEAFLFFGLPYESIIAFSDKQKMDLIVLGKHGKGLEAGVESFLVGSTSKIVSERAKAPVLLV